MRPAPSRRTARVLAASLVLATTVVTTTVAGAGAEAAPGDRAAHASRATVHRAGHATGHRAGHRSSGSGSRTADKPWSGFRLRAGSGAAGGFIGARRLADGRVVYRVQPQAKATGSKRYDGGTYAATLGGAPVTAVERAAWVVGKYGSYRDKVQDAAVEVALDDLLVGGSWGVKGTHTRARLAQLRPGQRKAVVRYANAMLAGSATLAGPAAISVTSPGATVGQPLPITVRATSPAGDAVPFLPATVTFPGQTPVTVRTDAGGNAVATVTGPAAGPQTVTTTVTNVPESRLLVLQPKAKKASRLVVAGVKTFATLTTSVAVRAVPVLGMDRSFSARTTTAGETFTLSSTYPTTRTATATLYGPAASDPAAVCSGRVVGRGSVTVRADGTYALPTYTLPQSSSANNYYRWQVSLPGDTYNEAPTTICAGVQVRTHS